MPPTQHVNLSRPKLVEWALKLEKGTTLTDKGALSVRSFKYTGRVPKAKRVVETPDVANDVDWGTVNIKMTKEGFQMARDRALKYLEAQDNLFVVNCFAGHDPKYRLKVRVITTRPYHAMFMTNMLVEPTAEELANFGQPDFTIYNAGEMKADPSIPGVTSDACVALNFESHEQVILGTQYAGEMKKGILTVMMYLLPKRGHLCMHASANEGEGRDVSVFFGLSGTGKTTLSADPHRKLIGDDEHVWTDTGIFNVEGGCYAKAVGLKLETEPDIYKAVRFGAVAENCILRKNDNSIDFDDTSITENTRVSYPLNFIHGAKLPAVTGHATNVIFLTNDAYGVLPPVSLLSHAQAMFWFVTGYTAKVAGTEAGVTEPIPTFSPCFGGPFLVFHPTYYGKQLAEKLEKHNARCWLVNTGWSGGSYGKGSRMKLSITRAIIDAIHDGSLVNEEFETVPGWGLRIPTRCRNAPSNVLNPFNAWANKAEFVETIDKLAVKFQKNFQKFASKATPEMLDAVPRAYKPPSKM